MISGQSLIPLLAAQAIQSDQLPSVALTGSPFHDRLVGERSRRNQRAGWIRHSLPQGSDTLSGREDGIPSTVRGQ